MQYPYVRQIPVFLRIVKPVTHNELIRYLKARVVNLNIIHHASVGIIKHCSKLKACRIPLFEYLKKIAERSSRINYVFDYDYIFSVKRLVQILDYLDNWYGGSLLKKNGGRKDYKFKSSDAKRWYCIKTIDE